MNLNNNRFRYFAPQKQDKISLFYKRIRFSEPFLTMIKVQRTESVCRIDVKRIYQGTEYRPPFVIQLSISQYIIGIYYIYINRE